MDIKDTGLEVTETLHLYREKNGIESIVPSEDAIQSELRRICEEIEADDEMLADKSATDTEHATARARRRLNKSLERRQKEIMALLPMCEVREYTFTVPSFDDYLKLRERALKVDEKRGPYTDDNLFASVLVPACLKAVDGVKSTKPLPIHVTLPLFWFLERACNGNAMLIPL